MKRLAIAVLGAAFGLALVVGTAFAHGPGPKHPGAGRTMSMHATGTAKLWIFHVSKGCHSWSDGKRLAETVNLTIKRGGRLVIVNEDIDAHKLVQLKGPRVKVGGAMMMNHSTKIVFGQAGQYRFKTKVVEMPGMPEGKTVGADHELAISVRVG